MKNNVIDFKTGRHKPSHSHTSEVDAEPKLATNSKPSLPKKISKIALIDLLPAFLIMILCVGFVQTKKINMDYIDGNVMNIGYLPQTQFDTGKISSPWLMSTMQDALMYRTLFTTNYNKTEIWEDMAESYAYSNDNRTITITLKEDLFWSNGQPITVDDVAFTIRGILITTGVNGLFKTTLENIVGASEFIENPNLGITGLTTNNRTITIDLINPHHNFLLVLSQLVILPYYSFSAEDILGGISEADYWKDPVVSGMYKLDSVVDKGKDDRYFLLVKNEYYSENPPKIDQVRILCENNSTPTDYYYTTDLAEVVQYTSTHNYTKYPSFQIYYKYLFFNMQGVDGFVNEPMTDINVRSAISLAIDLDTIFNSIFLEQGQQIYSGIPTSFESYIGNTHEYNPEKAKLLLEKAEYDFDRPIRIAYYHTDTPSVHCVEMIAKNLQEIGLKTEIIVTDNPTQTLYIDRDYDIAYKHLNAFVSSEWYSEVASTHNNYQYTMYNTDFDDVLLKLSQTNTKEPYLECLRELQQIELETLYRIPIYSADVSLFINTSRLNLPDDIVFGNTRYRSDIKLHEWEVKKDLQ